MHLSLVFTEFKQLLYWLPQRSFWVSSLTLEHPCPNVTIWLHSWPSGSQTSCFSLRSATEGSLPSQVRVWFIYRSWHLQVLPLHQVKIRHKEIYQVVVWLAGSEPGGILPASWSSWPWIMQTQCKQPAKEQRGIWTITEDVYGETNTSIRYVGTLKYD